MPLEWDASTYDRVADPQTAWAAPLVDRVARLRPRVVLDAGCGSGRVTTALVDRLPDARIVAVDGSLAMTRAARQRVGGRALVVQADLREPLPIRPVVDAILSSATFHWISDHDRLFERAAEVLRPGGHLVAQWGGAGNIAPVHAAVRAAAPQLDDPWTFATLDDTSRRLEAAGFEVLDLSQHDEVATFTTRSAMTTYLRTAVLGAHLDQLQGERRDALVRDVMRRLDELSLHYVRLTVVAHRRVR